MQAVRARVQQSKQAHRHNKNDRHQNIYITYIFCDLNNILSSRPDTLHIYTSHYILMRTRTCSQALHKLAICFPGALQPRLDQPLYRETLIDYFKEIGPKKSLNLSHIGVNSKKNV